MQLQLLGQVRYDNRVVAIPRKARALLAYLAVREGEAQREELAALFCANADDPRRTLRTLLSHVRRGAPGALTAGDDCVAASEGLRVDCHLFAEAARTHSLTPAADTWPHDCGSSSPIVQTNLLVFQR